MCARPRRHEHIGNVLTGVKKSVDELKKTTVGQYEARFASALANAAQALCCTQSDKSGASIRELSGVVRELGSYKEQMSTVRNASLRNFDANLAVLHHSRRST